MSAGERLELDGGGASAAVNPPPRSAAASRDARARILETAYELFVRNGIRAVGVDRIVAESGVAKMTLYRHFSSKEALVLAFLELRERRWTEGWLAVEIERRAEAGQHPLIAVFDALEEWFHAPDFEGCPFLGTLLEIRDSADAVHQACVRHLETIFELFKRHAAGAGLPNAAEIARQIQLLEIGAVVSAAGGDRDAASRARELAEAVLGAVAA